MTPRCACGRVRAAEGQPHRDRCFCDTYPHQGADDTRARLEALMAEYEADRQSGTRIPAARLRAVLDGAS